MFYVTTAEMWEIFSADIDTRRKKSSSMSQNHELLRTSLEEIATLTGYQADIHRPIIYKKFKKKWNKKNIIYLGYVLPHLLEFWWW